MSVSRAGGGSGYDNHDVQHVYSSMRMSNNLDLNNFGEPDMTWDQVNHFEPLGGLARDEIAELKVAVIENLMTARTSNSATIPTDAHAYWEVSLDPQIQYGRFDSDGNQIQVTDGAFDLDDDGTDDVWHRNLNIVDPDILWTDEAEHFSAQEDATAGSGMGGSTTYNKWILDYDQLFGGGPTLDRHDTVYVHGSLGGHGTTVFAAQERCTLYWQVRPR